MDYLTSRARRMWSVLQTIACAIALLFTMCRVPASAAMHNASEIWLFGQGGVPYEAVGYSIVTGHVFDPDGVWIGTVDAESQILDFEDDDIGYVTDAGPGGP